MKKLIAILVVFAMVAGATFAADLSATYIGSVVLAQGKTGEFYDGDEKLDNDVTSFGLSNRWRIEGSGESEDGAFGAWIRLDSPWYSDELGFEGLAWWKPLDQFKLTIGGNSDGLFGKEGFAGWMFHQIVADTSVVKGSQAWGCDYSLGAGQGLGSTVFRNAFYGGFGGQGLLLEIAPIDIMSINLIIPFLSETGKPWSAIKTEDLFKKITAQLDLNLDFGNIALTFVSGTNEFDYDEDDGFGVDASRIHLFFGLSSVENLDLGFSLGYALAAKPSEASGVKDVTVNLPLAIGLAAKYTVSDTLFIKTRVVAEFMGNIDNDGEKSDLPMGLIFEVLPGFAINDKATFFADIGVNYMGAAKDVGIEDAVMGWHFNPYVGIGSEWGPMFFAGINIFSTGAKDGKDNTYVNWEIPISLVVSF